MNAVQLKLDGLRGTLRRCEAHTVAEVRTGHYVMRYVTHYVMHEVCTMECTM